MDGKTYAILSLNLGIVGVLIALRPWTFVHPLGQVFLVYSLSSYASTVIIGLISYFPREFWGMNVQAMLENVDISNEELTLWTTKAILTIASRNRASAGRKGFWLKLSIFLFMAGTVLLAFALVA